MRVLYWTWWSRWMYDIGAEDDTTNFNWTTQVNAFLSSVLTNLLRLAFFYTTNFYHQLQYACNTLAIDNMLRCRADYNFVEVTFMIIIYWILGTVCDRKLTLDDTSAPIFQRKQGNVTDQQNWLKNKIWICKQTIYLYFQIYSTRFFLTGSDPVRTSVIARLTKLQRIDFVRVTQKWRFPASQMAYTHALLRYN